MAICVVVNADGTMTPSNASPDQCTGYLMVTPQEFNSFTSANSFFIPLTIEQGALIGAAILTVWATAFGFRVVSRMLSTATGDSE
ncbi:hypothetical protein [Chromobacterium sp. IIBBL 290-4]|uniref:hypothetical protein n=1 Tax=Chromobacterium sp. IIBBL 290-4 TaxID=2953890 RepID=UPI0020B791F5|nr:hypothetical protein [Chromobacterium sp. IIBBL 290-4]UTH73570.1 hypothetical protein NKT35_18815 [Chromobacterium sp. IIBBL 290-4]